MLERMHHTMDGLWDRVTTQRNALQSPDISSSEQNNKEADIPRNKKRGAFAQLTGS